jgi:hypothetical protein
MDQFPRWRELLQLAPDTKTVYGLMQDYIRSIEPLAGSFPEECRTALRTAEYDIQSAAVALLRAELNCPRQEVNALLHETAHIFASAAVRVTLVQAKSGAPAD